MENNVGVCFLLYRKSCFSGEQQSNACAKTFVVSHPHHHVICKKMWMTYGKRFLLYKEGATAFVGGCPLNRLLFNSECPRVPARRSGYGLQHKAENFLGIVFVCGGVSPGGPMQGVVGVG